MWLDDDFNMLWEIFIIVCFYINFIKFVLKGLDISFDNVII